MTTVVEDEQFESKPPNTAVNLSAVVGLLGGITVGEWFIGGGSLPAYINIGRICAILGTGCAGAVAGTGVGELLFGDPAAAELSATRNPPLPRFRRLARSILSNVRHN